MGGSSKKVGGEGRGPRSDSSISRGLKAQRREWWAVVVGPLAVLEECGLHAVAAAL